jgi:hypothetical protein
MIEANVPSTNHVDSSQLSTGPQPVPPDSPLPAAPVQRAGESTSNSPPLFPRSPGETPRAFSAFMTFFQLGHARSLQAVADKLGEGLPTVRNWSSKYDWSDRIQAYNTGLLQQQARDHADIERRHAADWAARLAQFREQEWGASQKLLAAAQCFLETFSDEHLQKMSLAEVSRALKIASTVGRLSLAGVELPASANPAVSPLQQQIFDALARAYGPAPAASQTLEKKESQIP